jgi:hypothetical protein
VAVREEEIRPLLARFPVERRLQARAALTGTVPDLLRQVRAVRAQPDGGWQAALSAQFMAESAARFRPAAQVAHAAVSLRDEVGAAVVLNAAVAARPPEDLAAIATELGAEPAGAGPAGLAGLFLASITARRPPADLVAVLLALPRGTVLHDALIGLISAGAPDDIANVILHLHGHGADEQIEALMAVIVAAEPGASLAGLLASLDHRGDQATVTHAIHALTTWAALPAAAQTLTRITDLVTTLLGAAQHRLAELVVTSAVANFSPSGQQYRLYALLFVFKQQGCHEEAQRVRTEIRAARPGCDEVDLIIEYCRANHDQLPDIVNLLRAVLENPKPRATASAALQLAKSLAWIRPTIFSTVSAWTYENLCAFEQLLRENSGTWPLEFREQVADHASERDDAEDIGEITLWLLRGAGDGRGKLGFEQASRIIRGTVQRRDPELMVSLICMLRGQPVAALKKPERWWAVRPAAAREIARSYDIDDMTALVKTGADRCLPALLWIATDWLLCPPGRGNAEIVALVSALREARGDDEELLAVLQYCGRGFFRADGTDPVVALKRAGLEHEAGAWIRGKHRPLPGMGRRPDPDTPRT